MFGPDLHPHRTVNPERGQRLAMESSRQRLGPWVLAPDAGFTLVELLVGVALTALVISLLVPLVVAILSGRRSLQAQTDYYESMRVPAALLMQDAQRAALCAADPNNYLKLVAQPEQAYIQYTFATYSQSHPDGDPDPQNLHRWEFEGGRLKSDEIIGWHLEQAGDANGPTFACRGMAPNQQAFLRLVKPSLTAGGPQVQLDLVALVRSIPE